MRGRCVGAEVSTILEHGAMQYADPKAKVAGLLEQPPIPAQGDVVSDRATGGTVVDALRPLLGLLHHHLRRLAQRSTTTLAAHVIADRIQLTQQALQPGDAELDAISHLSAPWKPAWSGTPAQSWDQPGAALRCCIPRPGR